MITVIVEVLNGIVTTWPITQVATAPSVVFDNFRIQLLASLFIWFYYKNIFQYVFKKKWNMSLRKMYLLFIPKWFIMAQGSVGRRRKCELFAY